MPQVYIRPINADDVRALVAVDHDYVSESVWQMEVQQTEEGQVDVHFRPMRLPRSVKVEYPRPWRNLGDNWQDRSGVLVATIDEGVVGYASLMLNIAPATAWVTDLAVARRVRRQGIGSALILAGQEWALQHQVRRLVLEMQPKNHPAISMAQKLGFDFCGYNDRYYENTDIGLFFARPIR